MSDGSVPVQPLASNPTKLSKTGYIANWRCDILRYSMPGLSQCAEMLPRRVKVIDCYPNEYELIGLDYCLVRPHAHQASVKRPCDDISHVLMIE